MKLNRTKIKRELKRKGWTLYRLAMGMKVRRQWVYEFMKPSYSGVTLGTVEKIAKALDVDPKDLLT